MNPSQGAGAIFYNNLSGGSNFTYANATSGGSANQLGTILGTTSMTGTITASTAISFGNGGAGGVFSGGPTPITDTASVTFNSTTNMTYSGAMSGGGAVAKNGSNILTLTGANTYSGTTTVSNGTLRLGAGSLGNTAISVASGATFAATPGSSSVAAGTTGAGTAGATLTLNAGSAFSMVDNSIGTVNLNQNTSFGSAGLVASVASGTAPTLSFDIGNSLGSIDTLNVTKSVTTNLGTAGVVDFQPLTGATSLATGDYTFITAASGLGPSAFTLGSSTITVGSNTYLLSLGDSTSTAEKLTVSVPVAVSWSSPVSAFAHLGGSANVGATLTNNDGSNTLSGYTVAASDTTSGGTITYTNPSSVNIAAGGSSAFSFGAATTGATPLGSTTITLTASGVGITSSPVTTTTTLNVYSGTSTWATNGSGSWGTLAGSGPGAFGINWGTNQGSPGLDPGFTSVDTATFDSALSSGSASVTLDGASPSLASLTFNNSSTSYTIAQGSGGTLTLNGGAGSASLTVLSGIHAISAPMTLATSTNVVVTNSADSLTISGGIGGAGGVNLSGSGILILGGSNNYSGGTAITSGTLRLAASNALPTSSDAVAVFANLDLNGFNQTVTGLSGGGTIASSSLAPTNNPAILTVNGGSGSFGGTLANNFGSGSGTVGLQLNSGTLTLAGNNTFTGGVSINGGTLRIGNSGALNSTAPNAVTFGRGQAGLRSSICTAIASPSAAWPLHPAPRRTPPTRSSPTAKEAPPPR